MSNSIPLYRLELVRDRSVPFRSVKGLGQAVEILHELLDRSPTEQMVVLYLDANQDLVGSEYVQNGNLANIFRGAIAASVPSIVIGHNHADADVKPSKADWDFTDKALRIGADLGINVVDHIIVSPTGTHLSMKTEDYKEVDSILGSLMNVFDSLPPEEREAARARLDKLGVNPDTLPRGEGLDLPPELRSLLPSETLKKPRGIN